MRSRLATALTDGCPVVAATVDADGQPKLAFFGSTHVHSAVQVAIWVRGPAGGTLRRLRAHPRISYLYRSPGERVRWVFEGRVRVVSDDPGQRARVYDESHENERSMDPEQRGVAVVIDVDL